MLRPFESDSCYSAKVLLLNQDKLTDRAFTFSSLARLLVVEPASIWKLHKKGLIKIESITIRSSYLSSVDEARDQLAQVAASVDFGTHEEALEKRHRQTGAIHPKDSFLGDDLHKKLKEADSVPIDTDAYLKIRAKAETIEDHVNFRIQIDEAALRQWLKEYIKEFALNTLDSGKMEAFAYEKVRKDVANFLSRRLLEGLSPASVVISNLDVWGKNHDALFKAHLFETLQALEMEGAISILEMVDEGIKNRTHFVLTSDYILQNPDLARVTVLGFDVLPLNQRVSIAINGTVRYRGRTLTTTKRPREILKIMSQKDVGESVSWDEVFTTVENWKVNILGKIPDAKKKQTQIYDAVKHINEQFRKKCEADFDLLEWRNLSVVRLK